MTNKRYRRQEQRVLLPDWVPDDIIHRSHLRERVDSRKHLVFTPGGGCAGSGCHCDSCILFTDNFSTNDLATGWNQVRPGSWSVAGNKLTGSGLLTCSTVPSPPGFFAHVVTVTITAVTGQHAQIIFNWSGSGYNYVDVYFNGGRVIERLHQDLGRHDNLDICQSRTSPTVRMSPCPPAYKPTPLVSEVPTSDWKSSPACWHPPRW